MSAESSAAADEEAASEAAAEEDSAIEEDAVEEAATDELEDTTGKQDESSLAAMVIYGIFEVRNQEIPVV